jgi:hypothetical protein
MYNNAKPALKDGPNIAFCRFYVRMNLLRYYFVDILFIYMKYMLLCVYMSLPVQFSHCCVNYFVVLSKIPVTV